MGSRSFSVRAFRRMGWRGTRAPADGGRIDLACVKRIWADAGPLRWLGKSLDEVWARWERSLVAWISGTGRTARQLFRQRLSWPTRAGGKGNHWFSKRAEHCRVAKNFGCEPFRRKPISREGRSTIAGRTPPWAADVVQECGRLEATAEEFFGVQMLVQGSDDGNVEGNGMPRLSSTNWRDQLGC